jgi:hypothetical protein
VQRLAEEPVEHRTRRTDLEGGADLAEDLALPGNERVETAGHPEEMEGSRLVGEPVDDRAQFVRRETADRFQRRHRTVFPVRADEVELGPVAGREADRLALHGERRRQVARLRERDERALADGDGRALV